MDSADWLLNHEHDERPALITPHGKHTHREVREAAEGFAAWLRGMGAQPGDSVAVVADSSFFSITCWLGAVRAGCVAISLSPSVSAEEWKVVVASTGVRYACLHRCTPAFTDPLPLGAHVVTETASGEQRAIRFSDAIAKRSGEGV